MKIKRKNILSGIGFRRWGEKGNTLILVALAMPVLLATAGLTIDWGRGVWTKTTLQKTADSAALAGASKLPSSADAEAKAVEMVAMNFDSPDDEIYSVVGNQITVELTENIDTLLMRILGYNTIEVSVSATAVGERNVWGLREGGFPFAIIDPNLNSDPADDFTPWNFGRPYIIGYGAPNIMVQDWANGSDPNPSNPGGGGGNSQGWRGALDLNQDGTLGGGGANSLRYCLEFGWPGEMSIGDWLPMEKGNMAGPIRDGREGRLGPDPIDWVDFDPVTDAHATRIVMVPIVHLIHETRRDAYTMQDYNNGADWDNQEVALDGFAPFFLLAEGEYEGYINANGNTQSWLVGLYVPGVTTNDWGDAGGGGGSSDYGLRVPPRLID